MAPVLLHSRAAKVPTPALEDLYPNGSYPESAGLPASLRSLLPAGEDAVDNESSLFLSSHYSSTRIYNTVTRRVVQGGAPPLPPARRRRPFPAVLSHPALSAKIAGAGHIPFLRPAQLGFLPPPVYRLLDATVNPAVNERLNTANADVKKFVADFAGDLPPHFYHGMIECDKCKADEDRTGACLFATLGSSTPAGASGEGLALRCLWSSNLNEACTFSFTTADGKEVKGVELFALVDAKGSKGSSDGEEVKQKIDGAAVAAATWWDGKDPRPISPIANGLSKAVVLRPEVQFATPAHKAPVAAPTDVDRQLVAIKPSELVNSSPEPPRSPLSDQLALTAPVLSLAELIARAIGVDDAWLIRDLSAVFDAHANNYRNELGKSLFEAGNRHAERVDAARAAFEESVKAADDEYVASVESARDAHVTAIDEHNRQVRAVASAVATVVPGGRPGLITAA